MRKLVSLRLLIWLVGTLGLAATAVIGASLTDSTFPIESATTQSELAGRSAGAPAGPPAPPVNSEPLTGPTDDNAAVVDATESATTDGSISVGQAAPDIAPINVGALDVGGGAVRADADAHITLYSEIGGATLSSASASGISPLSLANDGGLVAGDGVPFTGSASALPSFTAPDNGTDERGSGTGSPVSVPETSTVVLLAVAVAAMLIARRRA